MKRKIISGMLIAAMLMSCACSSETAEETTEESQEILDLIGNWAEESESGSYQGGYITEDTIEIFWIFEDDDSYALYWSGSYVAPTEAGDSYTWDSVNNTERTDSSMYASPDETKTFTYEDGVISYTVSFMGETYDYEIVPSELNYMVLAESSEEEEGTDTETESPTSADEVLSQVDVRSEVTSKGEVCVFITNNSDTVIDELDISAVFYDESGTMVDMDDDGHDMILPGYTVVSTLSTYSEYSTYETSVDIELGCNPNYENHSEEVDMEYNAGDGCAMVQITNNSDVTIEEIEIIAVFYKDGAIADVSYPEDIYDVEAGDTVTEKLTTRADFDDVEVYLNQAHTFGF